MKKISLILVLLLAAVTTFAQCWNLPDANTVNVSGSVKNQNYNGNTHFIGSATIENGTNINNWNAIIYDGSFVVNPPQNMNNRSNIYVNGSAVIDQVHFTGGDTLFINGSVVINKIVSNNSNQGSRNVIMLSQGSSLSYSDQVYSSETTIKTQGNTSNEVDVLICSSALPVHFADEKRIGMAITFTVGDQSNIAHYTLQGSNDAGASWDDLYDFDVDNSKITYALSIKEYSTTAAAAICLLSMFLIAGRPTRRNKILGIIMLAGILVAIGCSKKEVPTKKDTYYQFFRVRATLQDGTFEYSKIVSNA